MSNEHNQFWLCTSLPHLGYGGFTMFTRERAGFQLSHGFHTFAWYGPSRPNFDIWHWPFEISMFWHWHFEILTFSWHFDTDFPLQGPSWCLGTVDSHLQNVFHTLTMGHWHLYRSIWGVSSIYLLIVLCCQLHSSCFYFVCGTQIAVTMNWLLYTYNQQLAWTVAGLVESSDDHQVDRAVGKCRFCKTWSWPKL